MGACSAAGNWIEVSESLQFRLRKNSTGRLLVRLLDYPNDFSQNKLDEEETNLRLDKFLAASRLIKRRTLAKAACDCGRVNVNDRQAKPSAEVSPGDIIEIDFQTRKVKVRVLQVLGEREGCGPGGDKGTLIRPSKAAARLLYEEIGDE
jgi:ribosomal 50S subunit-recycling heat shock protein